MILAHDLNGQQAQALLHGLEAANCTAQVFFVALCLPGTTDGDDAATVAAFAIRRWGTRVVQRADAVAPLGRMLHATRGRRMTVCTPLGLKVGVRPWLQHHQDYRAVMIKTLQRRTYSVMVLAQEMGQPLLLPALTAFQRECHMRGGAMQWSTEVIRPGRQPGMATPEAYSCARHCIRLSGAGGSEAAEELVHRLKRLEGAECEGTLISSWTPEEHRDAVLAPVAHGAVPLVVECLRKLLGRMPLKILMIGGTLAIGEVDPAGIDAVMDDGGVTRWARHVMPAVRLLGGTMHPGGRARPTSL